VAEEGGGVRRWIEGDGELYPAYWSEWFCVCLVTICPSKRGMIAM
jgi:hypothetical protein